MKNYNQMQSLYTIRNRKVLVDYLNNDIKYYSEDTEFEYRYSEEFNNKKNFLESMLIENSNNEVLNIVIITGLDCNMKCVYCYEKEYDIKRNDSQINEYDIYNFIENMTKKNIYKRINISILGGEPILERNINFLDSLFKLLKNINLPYKINIVTNGMNILQYKDIIDTWAINEFQITLDGLGEINNIRRKSKNDKIDTFENVVKAVDYLLSKGNKICLRINVDYGNIDYINDFVLFMNKKNWTNNMYIYMYPVTSCGEINNATELEIFKKLLTELKKLDYNYRKMINLDFHGIKYIDTILSNKMPYIRTKFCGAEIGQFVINRDGSIYNCWWGIDNNKFKIGDLQNIDINKIKEFSDRNTLKLKQCHECKYKYICGAGCVYKEYSNKNTIDKGCCSEYEELVGEYLNYVL